MTTTLSPLEQDLPAEALRVLALSTRLATPCGDGEVVWHAWGEGEPLVLLHGGSGSWTHWLRNVETLAAAGRRVLVPDLPGFGDSARPPDGQDADAVAPALAASLRQLAGHGPFDIVGFSFGGLTGTLLAGSQPDLVRQLVLVGAPGLGLRSKRLALTAWRGFTDLDKQREAHRANLTTLMLHDADQVDQQAVDLQAANVPRDRMHRRKLALTDLLLQTLPSLQCPLSAIYGTEDALYRETRDQIAPLLQRAPYFRELVFIQGAGHWVQYEAPAEFHRALLRLLPS